MYAGKTKSTLQKFRERMERNISFCTDIRQKFRWSNDLESLRTFAVWLDREMEHREQGARGSTAEEDSESDRKK